MKSAFNSPRLLVVDDHARARESMAEILSHAFGETRSCGSAAEALEVAADWGPDVIVTDLHMPGMDGLELIQRVRERAIDAEIVMVTAHASVHTAVEAMRRGAFDYLEKPFDADRLESVVGRAITVAKGQEKRARLMGNAAEPSTMLVGDSRPMLELRDRIRKVAASSETTLIHGESGVGKELVARLTHAWSPRGAQPLVSLNCPALSPQLMESELFGHERGSFTGAEAKRVGRFELADRGAILLDEVSEIELSLQAKLLRVLQERCFERVGSSESRNLDVRVLATTNRDLAIDAKEGRFRLDLYYRLAVVPIHVPALRDRPEDIPQLIENFSNRVAQRLSRSPRSIRSAALSVLMSYHWPGNVRELENLVTRWSVLGGDSPVEETEARLAMEESASVSQPATRQQESLPLSSSRMDNEQIAETPVVSHIAVEGSEVGASASLEDMERRMIEATLARFDGHREKTAKALGIGVRTLTNKLRAYGYAPRTRAFGKVA